MTAQFTLPLTAHELRACAEGVRCAVGGALRENPLTAHPEHAQLAPHAPQGNCAKHAEAYKTKAARNAAYAAWNAAGRPWPPPAGLTSASLGALIKPRRERRW